MGREFKVKIVENKVEHSYLISTPNGSVLAKFRTDITNATDIGLDSELICQIYRATNEYLQKMQEKLEKH